MSIQDLFWRGECLDSPLAFDTETDSRCDLTREIPRLALASASDGDRLVLVHPCALPIFINLHKHHEWVGHNLASFDFWVVDQQLKRLAREYKFGEDGDGWILCKSVQDAQEAWWDLADQGRMHDTLLMDLLVRIALGRGESGSEESKLFPRNLALVAREYASHVPEPDKSSEFRLRYHELFDTTDWDSFPSGFFTYPLEDARATWWVWRAMLEQARTLKLKAPPGRIYADAEARFGVLTETLQVQGAIALAQATRHGLAVNQPLLAEREAAVRSGIEESLEWLQLTHLELFEFKKKSGKMVRQAKSQLPKFKTKVLQGLLSREAEAQGRAPLRSHGKKAADPQFKNTLAAVSVSVKEWVTTGLARSESNPSGSLFLKHWLTVADSKTTLGLFAAARACEGSVHPSYRTLVSTGRVSCHSPNLQQFPKGSGFREAFVARPGCMLYVCDYAAIELRTLAAICLARFGRSTLAEIFRRPKPFDDAHAYTASLLLGVPFEEFLGWKKHPDEAKRESFKRMRQASKGIAFGTPGGLGGPKLVAYVAAPPYNVTLTLEEALSFRERLITEIYPEIGWYLKDTTLDTLAHNLGLDPATARQLINDCCDVPDAFAVSLAKVLKGTPIKANGEPYKRHWVQTCWNLLGVLVRNAPGATPEHTQALLKREGSYETHDLFLAEPAVTPTGRLRGGVRFTQRLNAPFQGLAADGAKRALWRALQAGLPVAAFVHDELIFEFPIERAEEMAVQAKKVMESSMSEVLNHAVPVEAEGHLTPCWTK